LCGRIYVDSLSIAAGDLTQLVAPCINLRAGRLMSDAPESAAGASRWGSVELPTALEPRPEISHVLFDFDGTLSLIRQGWPEVMVPMFVEALPRLPGETDHQVEHLVLDDIMRLNGKQTIYQMIQLVERIQERGGQAREPLWYKHEYLRRLEVHIGVRTAGLKTGSITADTLLVHGARPLLKHLRDRGLHLYLACGKRLSFSISRATSGPTSSERSTTTSSFPRR
jgi:hypothetical protein